MDRYTPIQVIDATNLDREMFQKTYYQPQKPVVLRGLWKQYPAYEKWTMEFFQENHG